MGMDGKILPSRVVHDTAGKPMPRPPDKAAIGGAAMAPNNSHISPEVRADLGKLLPEQRAEILRVADSK
jgi:hypothetical protein